MVLRTEDGLVLRAEYTNPTNPVGTVVLCHPHPLHGGNMFASVIDTLFERLTSAGFACVRFNFRGVTGSDGQHEYGEGEKHDIVAAVDYLADRHPDLPLSLVGWSFGADVSLAVAHSSVSSWFAIAPPLAVVDQAQMLSARDERQKTIAVPEHDQFCSPQQAEQRVAEWQNTVLERIPNTDHFLNGRLSFVADLALRSLPRVPSTNASGA